MRIKTKRLPKLDDVIELDDEFLSRPDGGSMRPALIKGRRRDDGEGVLVKYWNKAGDALDAHLRQLWHREMRNADRIRVRPGGDELLVPVLAMEEARDAFYLVMPGEWTPLSATLRRVRGDHWLANLRSPARRQFLWKNVARIVNALDVLHGQRVVHGDLSEAVIFTASAHEPDFRLGGFEWCLRIGEDSGGLSNGVACSMVEDFRSLGAVVARLLGRGAVSSSGQDSLDWSADYEFSGAEQSFLRALMNPIDEGHFDRRRLGHLLAAVDREGVVAGWDEPGRYVLGIQLSVSSIEEVIGEETEWQVRKGDRQGQLAFVRADLSAGAEIVQKVNGDIWLLGEALAYALRPIGTGEKPWRGAGCRYVRPRDEMVADRSEPQPLPAGLVEVMAQAEVEKRLAALGARATEWTALVEVGRPPAADDDLRLGMLLTEVTLALYGSAEAMAVEIGARKDDFVWLVPAEDDNLDAMRAALNVGPSYRQLKAVFELEEGDADGEWELRESAALGGRREEAVRANFVRWEVQDGQSCYLFRLQGTPPSCETLYLTRSTDRNPHGVVHRRLRQLDALASHRELLRTLQRPESTVQRGGRIPFEEDDAYRQLDGSKQGVMRSLWRKTPLQIVVGPPGVGKTHLLADYVRRSLTEEPDRQILVTAQGHQALDNAGQAVREMLGISAGDDAYILVRSRSEKATSTRGLYASEHAVKHLRRVAGSPLTAAAPQELRDALDDMLEVAERGALGGRSKVDRPREVRAMEALVMQAANVLFATANSAELSRLLENGTAFDEVIIEEAAKATGPELLAAMLLSMQRLLIGDHNQLPAFDSDRLLQLLTDVERVKTVLDYCEPVIGGFFRDYGLEELMEASRDSDRLARVCERARMAVRLFETLVRRDDERAQRLQSSERIALELTEQHRMHPVICDFVSGTFYDNRLVTNAAAAERYLTGAPPFSHSLPIMARSPVLWIDMPYVQVKSGAGDEAPNYHNRAERAAVLAVLEQARAQSAGKAPTLAVLSPYLQQAERLARAIENERGKRLAHLSQFRSASSAGGFAGTVDSFQGSEADLVIISLVRNNGNYGRSALGFISDSRRMNVLISRSKWQLVLVGSLE